MLSQIRSRLSRLVSAQRHRVRFLCWCGLIGLLGCSSSQPPVAPVTGKITCQGKPVANAVVRFSPVDQSSGKTKEGEGKTNERGQFTLSTFGRHDGALVGKHKVLISYEDAYKHPPCALPRDLVKDVTAGSNEINIELAPEVKRK